MTVKQGSYEIIGDGHEVMDFSAQDMLKIETKNGQLQLRTFSSFVGSYKRIEINGIHESCALNIKPSKPSLGGRSYPDNLDISVWEGKLKIINDVDLNDYLAGVVQSEVGNRKTKEFYKTQAIISRTYALKHWYKYEDLGFNLCDRVSSQVYKTMCWNDTIAAAVKQTKDLVLVDSNVNLIAAVFHSNSGGQTTNSEDVWLTAAPYLRSVPDTFSYEMPHSSWTDTLSITDWYAYFAQTNLADTANDSVRISLLNYCPEERPIYFFEQDSLLPTKIMRRDFKLKSTWFCIEPNADSTLIAINGRGFGHGVGMPQEGAMRMAKVGYSYEEILHYYYYNVHIVRLSLLDYLREY